MNRYFGTHTLEGEWHAILPRYLLVGERAAGSRVLDIGCGTGIGASLLLELGAETVSGVDHRPEVVELARVKHDKQGLDFHVMFWEELDFPDDSFDMVVCLDPASPVTDPNLLTEVRRVLRDGGEYVCALERTTVAGFESLLPRYGYTSSADEVSIAQDAERVPQIGELSSFFETTVSLLQRPHISYVFEPEAQSAGSPEVGHMRRLPDSDGGLWADSEADAQPSAAAAAGKWIPVDRSLISDDPKVAAVELFFCGDAHLPPPSPREVRLPYYEIADRLEQLINDLQMRQNIGGEPSSFEEVLDEPSDAGDDAGPTSSEWDETPTQVLQRPALDSTGQPPRVVELESQVTHLADLYQQVRHDFDQILRQTEAALSERDEYINHLVNTVHEWEGRYREETGEDVSDTATTGVFNLGDIEESMRGEEPLLDELSALDDHASPENIAEEIASLEQERERIRQRLAERETRLDELKASLDEADDDASPGDDEDGSLQTDEAPAAADDASDSVSEASEADDASEGDDASAPDPSPEHAASEDTSSADASSEADEDADVVGEIHESTEQ